MKSLTKLHYLFLAAALAVGFACCDSDDDGPAEPEPVGPVYNESDVEVVRAAFKSLITNGCYGIWPEDSMEKILDDPGRWNNVYALWRLDEATNEHRIVELHLYGDGRAGLIANVPSSLGKLDKLKCLKVWGDAFYGEFPEEVCGLKNLTGIMIRGTNLFSIPEDLFNENMDYVWVTFNRSVTKLPGSVVKLKGPNFIYNLSERKFFNFNDNSFEGEVPYIPDATVYFFSNNFTSFDWNMAGGKKHPRTPGADGIEERTFTVCWWNSGFKGGVVPEEHLERLLADTLSLNILENQLYYDLHTCEWILDRYSNLPKYDEREKMYLEYFANHPDHGVKKNKKLKPGVLSEEINPLGFDMFNIEQPSERSIDNDTKRMEFYVNGF